MNSNTSRVILVTGDRKGIGRYLSEHLLRQGYNVVGCSRNPADWQAERYTHYQADVTLEDQITRLFRDIRRQHKRLDAVINNAGFASMNHALLTPMDTVHKIVDTNLVGTFLVCREAAKLMRKHKFGRIINFGSAAVPLRLGGEAAYIASKSAIVSLSQVLAHELAEFGITINIVGPSPTETDMIRGVPKDNIDNLVNMLPIKRLTKFEDIANVVDFFLREESSMITGQVIYMAGAPNL